MLNSVATFWSGEELLERLTHLPEYNIEVRDKTVSERLLMLSDLYQIYLPSKMTVEIYNKLYRAMMNSLQKKNVPESITQRYLNYQRINNGIIGGSDSFTIIGNSGIGKSSAIFSSMRLMEADRILINQKPHMEVIPVLIVQCPFDCSVKSLLLSIFKAVDDKLGTNEYEKSIKTRKTIDTLITSVSQLCLNHVGLLVVDEIQNVVTRATGDKLVGCLTQLINSSGISICMVGTPEATEYFMSEMQLARRSVGLKYNDLPYNDFFIDFCKTVVSYQYVKYETEITENIIEWLYEKSHGVISIVVSLIHDAQEIAILEGYEKLDLLMLNRAYNERMIMLHDSLRKMDTKKFSKTKKKENNYKYEIVTSDCQNEMVNIVDVINNAKAVKNDVVLCLKQYFPIIEI